MVGVYIPTSELVKAAEGEEFKAGARLRRRADVLEIAADAYRVTCTTSTPWMCPQFPIRPSSPTHSSASTQVGAL